MEKEITKAQVRDLYISSDLSQQEIADTVGVTRKTVSTWIKSGDWKKLKLKFCDLPVQLAVRFEEELSRLTDFIATRPPQHNFPTFAEARTRTQIIQSINLLRSRVTTGPAVNILLSFIDYIAETDPEEAETIFKHADKYINNLTDKEKAVCAGITNSIYDQPEVF